MFLCSVFVGLYLELFLHTCDMREGFLGALVTSPVSEERPSSFIQVGHPCLKGKNMKVRFPLPVIQGHAIFTILAEVSLVSLSFHFQNEILWHV